MAWTFNPFSGTFDQKGSGGGGGSSYLEGEVQNFSALPTSTPPAVDAAYLVREAEGAWLISRKPAGIYIRVATTGTRATDWQYAGEFPDVFSDANFLLYDESDSTKNLKFQLSGITTGTTRTLTAPNNSGTIALTTDAPSAHAASHAAGTKAIYAGIGDVTESLATPVSIRANNAGTAGNSITLSFNGTNDIDTVLASWNSANPSNQASLSDGDGTQVPDNGEVITLSGGTNAGADPLSNLTVHTLTVAGNSDTTAQAVFYGAQWFGSVDGRQGVLYQGDEEGKVKVIALDKTFNAYKTLELVSDGDTFTFPTNGGTLAITSDNADQFGSGAAADGYVLTSDGAGGAAWEAATGGDTVSIETTAADILSVSSGAISADDAGADRIVYWNNTSNKLAYGTPSDVGAAATSHNHAASDITSGTLLHERGGLEADVSAYNGLVKIASGSTSAVTVTSAGEALLDDADAAAQRTTLGLGNSATLNTGTTAGTVAAGDHTHSQLHDRSHAITSASDHTAGNNKIFYSDNTGAITELALGANGTVLTSNGATSAPSFAAASGGIGGGTGSTDNAILRADGTGGSTAQNSAFIIADNATASPNNTVNHASISVTGDTTNVSVSIVPKGSGALSLAVPNSATSGGNVRGANAVDLQISRTAAAQVASGAGAGILCGTGNTSSSTCSIAAGENCTSSATYTIVLGRSNSASGGAASAVIGGQDNSSTGRESFIAAGNRNSSTAGCCAILSGDDTTLDRPYMVGHSGGRFAAGGDSQSIHINLRAKTTNATAVQLTVGGYAVSSQTITIPAGKVISGIINIHGVKSDGSAVAHFVRQFSYKRVGATSSLLATATIGTDYNPSALTVPAFNDPDTNGDAISISVTGEASATWRWTADLSAVETAYGT